MRFELCRLRCMIASVGTFKSFDGPVYIEPRLAMSEIVENRFLLTYQVVLPVTT